MNPCYESLAVTGVPNWTITIHNLVILFYTSIYFRMHPITTTFFFYGETYTITDLVGNVPLNTGDPCCAETGCADQGCGRLSLSGLYSRRA